MKKAILKIIFNALATKQNEQINGNELLQDEDSVNKNSITIIDPKNKSELISWNKSPALEIFRSLQSLEYLI